MMRLEDFPDDTCPNCGEELPPVDHNRIRIYCSRKCVDRHKNRLDAERRARERAGKTCPVCGATFDAARADQTYCSLKCCNASSNRLIRAACAEARAGKTCRGCGVVFDDARRSDQIYCTLACGEAFRRARKRARRATSQ